MLLLCDKYSSKWRFEYNPRKCSVVVFNESTNCNSNRVWKIGNSTIQEGTKYCHLGTIQSKFIDQNENVHNACIRLRGTLLAIANSGLCSDSLNPLTLYKIYKSVVIPKALYGCELWNSISKSSLLELEKSHLFCLKYIQKFPLNTNNDITYQSICSYPISVEIEYAKLQFLGQLCRLPCKYLAKQMFVCRFVRFINSSERQAHGFIPDIFSLAKKYGLLDYVSYFANNADFPSKYMWKSVLHRQVYKAALNSRISRLEATIPRCLIDSLFPDNGPSCLWIMARRSPTNKTCFIQGMRILAKLLSFQYPVECNSCNCVVDNQITHKVFYCGSNDNIRIRLWREVLVCIGLREFSTFIQQSTSRQILDILSNFTTYTGSDSDNSYSGSTHNKCLKLLCCLCI